MEIFCKETLNKGKPTKIDCLDIGGQTFTVSKGFLTRLALEEEWYEDIVDPQAVINVLQNSPVKIDIFTFWQRLPQIDPRYNYYKEFEPLAVLPIKSFDYWWEKQLKASTRNMIRKSEKQGVDVVETEFSDDFVKGMTTIYNETPVRQGRHFWHYGKDFDTVKKQFSRYLYREYIVGAYYKDELIGFLMLANAGPFALVGQILSKISHRDKATNNALIAKAVKICESQQIPLLVYAYWGTGSFAGFKHRSGFEKILVPRYYVPLTGKGSLALRMGLHRGLKAILPESLKERLKVFRAALLERIIRQKGQKCQG
jgi:hypothetical protein